MRRLDRLPHVGLGSADLCRLGGVAALILIAYSVLTIAQFALIGGQPATAAEAFDVLQTSKLVGLLRLDLPTMLALPLYYLLFLGLFEMLEPAHRAYARLATALAFAGVTLLLATPSALSMLSLSRKYNAATTEAAKAQLLAAGEAVLASDLWHATGAALGGVLLQSAGVLICFVMLRSTAFGKLTAWLGISIFALDLGHILIGLCLPTAGVVLMAISGPLYPVWFFLAARKLLRAPASAI